MKDLIIGINDYMIFVIENLVILFFFVKIRKSKLLIIDGII